MTDWMPSDLVPGQVPDGINTPAAVSAYTALLARLISAEAQVVALAARPAQVSYIPAAAVSAASLTALLMSLSTVPPTQPGVLWLQSGVPTVSPGTATASTAHFTLRDGSQVRLRNGSYASHR